MRNEAKGFSPILMLIIIAGIILWIINLSKFVASDYMAFYGIGVFIPPVALITAWFDKR